MQGRRGQYAEIALAFRLENRHPAGIVLEQLPHRDLQRGVGGYGGRQPAHPVHHRPGAVESGEVDVAAQPLIDVEDQRELGPSG